MQYLFGGVIGGESGGYNSGRPDPLETIISPFGETGIVVTPPVVSCEARCKKLFEDIMTFAAIAFVAKINICAFLGTTPAFGACAASAVATLLVAFLSALYFYRSCLASCKKNPG
jgi:hypothetical protein